jgi:hypothetical protein
MPRQSTPSAVATIGIDIGKNTFHLVGLDQRGADCGGCAAADHDLCDDQNAGTDGPISIASCALSARIASAVLARGREYQPIIMPRTA